MQPSVTFIGFGNAGVSHYRTFLPARALGANLFIRSWDKQEDGTAAIRVDRMEGDPNGDICIYSMPMHEYQLEECQNIVKLGSKLIVDIDDDLAAVAASESHVWGKDMRNHLPNHEGAIELATLLTASTPHLARVAAEKYGKPVYLCENGLDLERYNIRQHRKPKDRWIMGWEGGIGHEDAWDMLAPQVRSILHERKDANIFIVGQALPEHFDPEEFPDQIIYHEWQPGMTNYILPMTFFDVGLAPSQPTDFYRAKSPLRLLEYSALTIPPMCSPTTYGDHLADGDTERGMIVQDGDWAAALLWAYENRKEVRKMGLKAQQWVRSNFTMEHTKSQWQAAIKAAQL